VREIPCAQPHEVAGEGVARRYACTAVFDLGNEFEQIIMKDLNEAGIPSSSSNDRSEWREYQITGHIDGKLLIDDQIVPFDAKSCSPFVFNYISGY